MKSHKTIIAALAAALTITTSTAAREAVIGLSPLQAPESVRAQAERIVQHLVESIGTGETALLFDAANVRLIGSFTVPDKAAYANPRAKLQANRKLLSDLKRFIDGAQPVPGRDAHVDMPGFLAAVRQSYPVDHDRALIVLGSPTYNNPKAPSVSMKGARVPSDGHLLASPADSPFGTAGLVGSLSGTDIYFGVVGKDDQAVSTQHAYHVERFWTLSAEAHGASMQYFGDDLETLLRLAAKDDSERRHAHPPAAEDKLEMLRFLPDDAEVPDLYTAPTEAAAAAPPVWQDARDVRVGLTWDCKACDLDLYVRPAPGAPAIYFGKAETEAGRLFKDFRASPSNGFETVQLNGAVDLSETHIAVNFYGGRSSSSSVNGELRIAIGDSVWAAPFSIVASIGNRGAGAETAIAKKAAPNAQWVIVDPMGIITGGGKR